MKSWPSEMREFSCRAFRKVNEADQICTDFVFAVQMGGL